MNDYNFEKKKQKGMLYIPGTQQACHPLPVQMDML